MTDEAAGGVLVAVGVLLGKLVATGRFVDYVRPGMRWLLVAAGGVAIVAGLVVAGRASFAPPRDTGPIQSVDATFPGASRDPCGMAAGGTAGTSPPVSRIAWVLVVPIALLSAVPAAPLGSFAATLAQTSARPPPARSLFPALRAGSDGQVAMSLADFVSRSLYDPAASLRDIRVRLVGFAGASEGRTRNGFDLIRFAIYCCAADAVALRVRVVVNGTGPQPPPDTWLAVTGVWRPAPARPPGPFDPADKPVLVAASVVRVTVPSNPYDSPQ